MKQRVVFTARPGSQITKDYGRRRIDGTEVLELTVEGDFDLEVEDLDAFVQVQVSGMRAYGYTYRDPSGELQVGDRVLVPFGAEDERLGKVVELGRGSWTGYAKDVAAVLDVTELAA